MPSGVYPCIADARPRRRLFDKNPDRFWSKVERCDLFSCWEWKAGKCFKGYGSIAWGSKIEGAHRVSWELTYGYSPGPGLVVMHSCDNPGCVNPSHLLLGTVADNNADRDKKGRCNSGIRCREKTHCKHGHAFTPENTYLTKHGRSCRECARIAMAELNARLKAERHARGLKRKPRQAKPAASEDIWLISTSPPSRP